MLKRNTYGARIFNLLISYLSLTLPRAQPQNKKRVQCLLCVPYRLPPAGPVATAAATAGAVGVATTVATTVAATVAAGETAVRARVAAAVAGEATTKATAETATDRVAGTVAAKALGSTDTLVAEAGGVLAGAMERLGRRDGGEATEATEHVERGREGRRVAALLLRGGSDVGTLTSERLVNVLNGAVVTGVVTRGTGAAIDDRVLVERVDRVVLGLAGLQGGG